MIIPGFLVPSAIHTHNIQAQPYILSFDTYLWCAFHMPSIGQDATWRTKWWEAAPFQVARQTTAGIWKPRVHTWLIVFSICTKPRLGSVFFMKSTIVSRFSCCRIKGLWLPKRLRATLNMTSDPWRKIISRRHRNAELSPASSWPHTTVFSFPCIMEQKGGKYKPKLQISFPF